MKIEELVAKQQLEIENLKEDNQRLNKALNDINLLLICVGGPLNDNFYQYNEEQLKTFKQIACIIHDWGTNDRD